MLHTFRCGTPFAAEGKTDRKMKKLITIAAAALFAGSVQAQEIALPVIDAQALGMGGVTMTSVTGAHTLYNNAAATAFSLYPARLSASYYGQAEFDYYGISGYWRVGRVNTIQGGWRQYLREKGNHDAALDLGYTHRIGEEWAVGIVGRYMQLKRYEERAEALAVDVSAAWQHPIEGLGEYALLRVGAKLTNLGAFLDDTPRDLPMQMKGGVALETLFSDAHQLTVGADLGYSFTPSAVRGFEAAVGAEYTLMQLIRLRAGYHVGERKAYYPSFGSLGAGISLLHLRVDFAYLLAEKGSFLRNTYSISFGLDF